MKISHVLIGLLILTIACNNAAKKKTPNGFEFKVVKKGDGVLPKSGQIIIFNLFVKDSKDSIWADTYKRGLPERSLIGDSAAVATEDGLTQMLRMLSKGDSATFDISIKKLFAELKRPVPLEMDSTLQLNYTISIRDILNQEDFNAFREKVMQEYMAVQEKHSKEQLGKDTTLIDEHLNTKGVNAQKLPSGIRYTITQQGSGPMGQPGQTVQVEYTGYLLDGKHFDTSVKSIAQEKGLYDSLREKMVGYKPYEIVIDETQVIQGWHEALKQMNEGSKGTFYIPSTLAYGTEGRPPIIKENAILVFDLEVTDIK